MEPHIFSLRHIYSTALSATSASVKTHQSLTRHSDPRLTLNVYTHGVPEQERAAIESLPDLNMPQEQRMTGTDDSPVDCISKDHSASSAIYSAINMAEHCIPLQSIAKTTKNQIPHSELITAISAKNERPRRDSNLQPLASEASTLSN